MYRTLLLILILVQTYAFQQPICNKDSSVDISNGNHSENGDITHNHIVYRKNEYYIDAESKSERGCICTKKICVRKCCPFGFAYNNKLKKCDPTSERFNPPIWDNYREMKGANVSAMFNFIFGKVNCTLPATRVRIKQVSSEIYLRRDGTLYIELPDDIPPYLIRSPKDYCIDTVLTVDESGRTVSNLDALVCSVDEDMQSMKPNYIMSSTCMMISCVFILATLAVYAWLPELRNLHGRVLMAYLTCLFVGFAFMATMQILILSEAHRPINLCLAFTLVIYFSLLAAFFWLNVMSFDIWWTFSGKRGLSLERLSSRARFAAYCLYAFGIPTLLTMLIVILEFTEIPHNPWLPNVRNNGCFLYGLSKLVYLYGPMVILCVANLVFFILTAVRIARIKRQTSVLNSKDSSTHDTHSKDRQRLLLYLKLFAVMGVNWILEVVSAIKPDWQFWKITDAYNVLIGLIIFIIFVCKRKILRLMKKRHAQLRGEPMSSTQMSSRTISDYRMTSIKNNNN